MGHSWTALHALEAFLQGNADGGPEGFNTVLGRIRTERELGARSAPDVPHANYELGFYRPNPSRFPYLAILWEDGNPLNEDVANGDQDNGLTVVILLREMDVDRAEAGVGLALSLYEDALYRMMRRGSHGGQDVPLDWAGWRLNGYPGVSEARLVSTAMRPEPALQHGNLALGASFRVRTVEN
jgi:hypothetical protein